MRLNYALMGRLIGLIVMILGLAMVPALLVSLFYHETEAVSAFLRSMIPMALTGSLLVWRIKPKSTYLKLREGSLIVALSWLLASLLGAVPYVLSGAIPDLADAFFESASGFSTTGASIIRDIEAVSHGVVFWRSFTHWLGGMGILALIISILPALGIGGQRIAQAETPGSTTNRMAAKMSDTGRILYLTYLSLSMIQFFLLLLGGMNGFDAMIHTFGSMGSGGLSNYSNGVAHFNSFYIEMVISVFTILTTINFTLYYHMIRGQWYDFLRDPEFKVYLGIILSTTILIAANLTASGLYDPTHAMRYALFHSASFSSTSGFSIVDFDLWPSFSKMLLIILAIIGGCSASTGGGIKVIRIIVVYKMMIRGLFVRLHPRAVVAIKVHNKTVPSDVASGITSFIFLYFSIFVVSVLILSLENLDMITTITAVIATMSNVGVGFGLVGPASSFDVFTDPAKIYLSILMLAGRLELYTLVVLLSPTFWNPDK